MTPSKLPRNLAEWLALLEQRHPRTIDLGLDRCGEVWQRMGAPRPAPVVFAVAGTNGKGSVVATICALLTALGHRCGTYTSPHILRYNERIQVAGEQASDEALIEAFERVEAARGATSLTYFEFGTLAAFQLLAGAGLDHAVMEVGLGGRLDAVNLLDADISVITPIGLDHQEYLGNDLESIGREKAGIIRSRRPLVVGEAQPPSTILQVASELQAPVKRLGAEFQVRLVGDNVIYTEAALELRLPRPALPGPHQVGNLATGVAAVLTQQPKAAGRPDALARGVRAVRVAGRFERLSQSPAIWVDVGHNPLGARAIAAALAEARTREGFAELRCVLGMLRDKDAAGVAAELRDVVTRWYCASLTGDRGQTADRLAERIAQLVAPAPVSASGPVGAALDTALIESGPGDAIVVFGSFQTAAEAVRHWAGRSGGRYRDSG